MKEKNIKQLITDNIVIVVLVLLVIGFSIGNSTFLKTANVINLFGQMCLNAILATGLTYVIILGVSISALVLLWLSQVFWQHRLYWH